MTLTCVGLGPGGKDDLTARARAALDQADVVVGYTTYVNLVRDDYPDKQFVATGMRGEEERCQRALELAEQGKNVAVVCSGDPGVYGMAGLLLTMAQDYQDVQVQVVPGVTAANGGAALLGAPLMHDWCSISLSDLMTPWELIERRLEAAAQADFCIALYNPASKGRADYLRRACQVLLRHRHPETVCGVARNIGRAGQQAHVTTLAQLQDEAVDMLTCVFVGNSQTRVVDGRMVTPRGYQGEREVRMQPTAGSPEGRAAGDEAANVKKGLATEDHLPEVLVFGGTVEGRQLVEWLDARGTCRVVACTATEYGASLLESGQHVSVLQGPLSDQQKHDLLAAHDFCCVVDATHPYARHITQSVRALTASAGLPLLRVVRESQDGESGPWTTVDDADQAAQLLSTTSGNVLLTTGSKDLVTYVQALPNWQERLYVRVLPTADAVNHALELGIPASHLVAMQGPFSQQLNEALIRQLDIQWLVSKQSGPQGGFPQKVAAAQTCGTQLLVIARPPEEGLLLGAVQALLEERYGL